LAWALLHHRIRGGIYRAQGGVYVEHRAVFLGRLGPLTHSIIRPTGNSAGYRHSARTVWRPYCIILVSCKPGCKPGFRSGLQPDFRQVRTGLQHAFNQLSTFFYRKPGREPQQVRWFVRVLDKWNVEKTVLSKLAAGFRHAFDLLATRFSTRFAAG